MKNKRNKKQFTTNNGITLIALVITIIVLLVLAGVTIVTLTGDNGILTKANEATQKNSKSKAEEEIKLSVGNLQIEEINKELKTDEKISILESELKSLYPEQITKTKVSVSGSNLLVNHRGYEFYIDSNYNISDKTDFNSEEWDKTATPEECFVWKSNIKGEEGYGVIVGFTANLQSYSKVRIPSRCEKITGGGEQPGDEEVGRVFFEQVEKIEIPNTVKEIGQYAFCTGMHGLQYSLKEINIPNSVTNIGMRAFGGCINLKKIIIPKSVVKINWSAFEYWNDTQTINFQIESEMPSWENEWNKNCNANIVYGYIEE